MINEPVAAQRALLAMYAEEMFNAKSLQLAPDIDSRCAKQWSLRGHLLAKNALLDGQYLQLGETAYFGFVAQSQTDHTQFIAVVRGTEAPVEWLENFEGLLVDRPHVGWVEQGFDSIYCSFSYVPVAPPIGNGVIAPSPSAAAAIAQLLDTRSTVTVIGHSLGAALASYLMLDLATVPHRPFRVEGTLFACPRAGGRDFVDRVNHAVDDYVVYNYMRDLVPHVPPSLPLPINFESFPKTVWIKAAEGQVVVDNTLACNHHAYCYAALLDANSVEISAAATPCITARSSS